MSDTPDERHEARFSLWQSPKGDKARINVVYRGIHLAILWYRADDDSDHGDMGDLIEALPDIWNKVHTEIDLQAEFRNLDTELDDLLNKKGESDE